MPVLLIKVYWVQLLTVIKYLCRYMLKHKVQLPAELQGPAGVFNTALTTFCDVLLAYDASHPRGKGT